MNKPEKNFFYVNRKLLHSDRWLSEKFTRGQAWIDLIGLAQHTDGFIRVRGIKVTIKRGQLGYSQLTLAKRWGWSVGKIKRYLNELEMEGDIEQQNSKITTLISIVNYSIYQGDGVTDGVTNSIINDQQTTNKRETYNKVNNDNKEKKENAPTKTFPKEEKLDYGEFKKVKLTANEYIKLTERMGEKNTNILIDELDTYIASTGKRYSSHHATILAWARRKVKDITSKKNNVIV